jgi:primosomal protein N' (replication factor Y)
VVVLHSGLTAAQRALHYEQFRDGHATTVIGPRSAVFAPARSLGLIVVDEEHEATYKQDTVPRYHGRDVAIKRAALEDVPVLLGSATPSLESLLNAQRGRYDLLRLPRRIRGLPMPALRLVELRKEIARGRIELIGRTLAEKIAAALDREEQIILLLNRRGYANYVFCPSCGWRMECEDCTRTMVFHQAIGLAMCHYCQSTAEVPRGCPACGKKLLLFGLGIQRIESELARKFPSAVVARMDSDTMTSPKQFRQVFDGFAAGRVDILLGTQMVAKGLDFPTVTLVGIVSADTALAIPDFRAAERTFQLVVQVAGRAGRGHGGGEVVVQTLHPGDPAIQFALRHDYEGFAASELPLRASAGVPPYVRLVRLLVRHPKPDRAESAADRLGQALRGMLAGRTDVRLVGPMRAGVFKIRRQFRYQLNCYCTTPGVVQNLLSEGMAALSARVRAEIVVDADPANLI